jgi:OOP family OmpA-OmpF porin
LKLKAQKKMKKLLLVMLTILPVLGFAQQAEAEANDRSPDAPLVDTSPPDTTPVPRWERSYAGLKASLNFPRMGYHGSSLSKYSSSFYAKGGWGIFGEIPLRQDDRLWVRPELSFITRGQHISDKGVSYALDARYVSFAAPVYWLFDPLRFDPVAEYELRPYAALAPSLSFASSGTVALDGWEIPVSTANLASADFGFYLGAGLRYALRDASRKEWLALSAELGYYLGLSDTYSSKERGGQATALNVNQYDISSRRTHRGLQAQVLVAVPLRNFKPKKRPAPVQEPEPEPEPLPVVEAPAEKPCYTIDEMRALLQAGENMVGKKICAITQITFETGRSELNAASRAYLDEIVLLLQINAVMKVTVNGHTDNVGTAEANLNLSRTRARAVHSYLLSRGIDAARLDYRYYGMTRPIADNDTEEGRATNRRVEFEIINQ